MKVSVLTQRLRGVSLSNEPAPPDTGPGRPAPARRSHSASPLRALTREERTEFDAYRLMRAVDHRPIADADLARLGQATASLSQARVLLRFGPGNTTDRDAHLDPHAPSRARLARALRVDLIDRNVPPIGADIAAALSAAGGNCGEFSCVVKATHVDKLPAEASLETLVGVDLDHEWLREVPAGPVGAEPVVLDAWALGSAVFEDDAWTRDEPADCFEVVDPSDAEFIRAATGYGLDILTRDADHYRQVKNEVQQSTTPLHESEVWSRRRTLHREVAAQAFEQLSVRIEPADPGPALQRKIDQGFDNLSHAAAVLRQFDDTRAAAPLDAPALVSAARTLADKARRI